MINKRDGITVLIPAYNEEKNLKGAVDSVLKALKQVTNDFEIIIIDDGSIDETGEISDSLQRKNPRIKVVHNKPNKNLGYNFRLGIKIATKLYLTLFPGDNDMSWESLVRILKLRTKADFITSFMKNTLKRTLSRRVFSKTYVIIMNTLFGLHLRYFNGPFIFKVAQLRLIPLTSEGYSIYSETKVRLLKSGATYLEVPFEHIGRRYGKSKAVSVRSIIDTIKNVITLYYDIYVCRNRPILQQ